MKKRNIIKTSIVLLSFYLILFWGNVVGEDQLEMYLPVNLHNFCYDFFDDFSNPSSGWTIRDDEYAKEEYLDGEYRVLIKDAVNSRYRVWPPQYCYREYYSVEFDIRWVGEPGESYGILFDKVAPTYPDGYLFLVGTTGTPGYSFEQNGYPTREIYSSPSSAINSGSGSNHLKVTRFGNQVTLEINGIVLGTWIIPDPVDRKETYIYIEPRTEHSTFEVRIDNFSITMLNQKPSIQLQEPVVLTGSGDSVVDYINPFPVSIAHITGNSAGQHFEVTSYNTAGETIDLLVNTTESYDGTVLLDMHDTHTSRFEIDAVGEWTIIVDSLSNARELEFPGIIEGTGDDVIILEPRDPNNPHLAKIQGNKGAGYFGVTGYNGYSSDLLVNTTDPYEGTVFLASVPIVIEFKSIGNWYLEITRW
jgi:hypothetical protein